MTLKISDGSTMVNRRGYLTKVHVSHCVLLYEIVRKFDKRVEKTLLESKKETKPKHLIMLYTILIRGKGGKHLTCVQYGTASSLTATCYCTCTFSTFFRQLQLKFLVNHVGGFQTFPSRGRFIGCS